MSTDELLTDIEFNLGEARDLSQAVLELLDDEGCDVAMGAIACTLSLGNLLSPTPLLLEEEIAFMKAAIEFAATYFTIGVAN